MGARRTGVQAEVLLSLGLVMALSTAVLGALLFAHHERTLRELCGRALVAEARAPRAALDAFVPGTRWWTVPRRGAARPRGPFAGAIDAAALDLAARARARGEPLLEPGAPWEPIRIAVPLGAAGEVAVAALPREASFRLRFAALGVLGGFFLADVVVFTALGAYLLRQRVVLPLRRLAAAARSLAAGEPGARAPVDGVAEAAALAEAWNETAAELEARTGALEKAVVELRDANRDLRRARQGLARAERLAAVGRLAAGVAHEIGNPIGAILALVDLAARDAGLSAGGRAHLERASREGARVRTILRQLLDFARPPRPAPAPVDLAAAAEQTVALVRAQRRYAGIDFRVEHAEGAPTARADAAAVAQILMNLLLNAGDAAAAAPEPRILVQVRPSHSGERRRGEEGGPPPPRRRAEAVECVVCDNGAGIDPADRERVFDPFFTTKPVGEGTGLGLANAALLAEELEGTLELADPPAGMRTAFALRLPAEPAGTRGGARSDARGSAAAGPQNASGCAAGFAPEADPEPAAGAEAQGAR